MLIYKINAYERQHYVEMNNRKLWLFFEPRLSNMGRHCVLNITYGKLVLVISAKAFYFVYMLYK